MSKLIITGLFLLLPFCIFADEYISSEYYEEMNSQPEFVEQNESIVEFTEEVLAEETVFLEPSPAPVENEVKDEVEDINLTMFEKNILKAKREHKVILLVIRATDCKYCDEMEKGTLSDESIKEALDADFLTLNYNQDTDKLPLNLNEGMTPNFIFVDSDENIINMYPGMRTPSQFKEALNEILQM